MTRGEHVPVTAETVTERDIEALLRSSPDEAVQRLAGAALDKRTDPRFLPDLKLRIADAINARAARAVR